ncbi:MAG TPA: hypothetical protein VFK80_03990, partial [Limnochordia bacterium]|nr:hypothetical protein [Limnochordia bacterium]
MLRDAIYQIRIIDTHEHLEKEPKWVEQGPDALGALFDNYVLQDIVAAGVPSEAATQVVTRPGDVRERFGIIAAAWARAQHTGYGEAVRLAAEAVYGIDHIDAAAL